VAFRLHVSDGTVFDIRHPELLMVSPESALVGLPSPTQQLPQIERYQIVDLAHIVRLESLAIAKTTGNGQ
jgi:hypothetical protein